MEANHQLTWRDLQHLIVQTPKLVSPNDDEWQTNGAGHQVNTKFGFAALNADALVRKAVSNSWKTVQPQHTCETDVYSTKMFWKQTIN